MPTKTQWLCPNPDCQEVSPNRGLCPDCQWVQDRQEDRNERLRSAAANLKSEERRGK